MSPEHKAIPIWTGRTSLSHNADALDQPMDMPMLHYLSILHYRSFRLETVELDNPTLLVGPNGSGKSNLVDALSLLSEAMESPLAAVFKRRGGFASVAHRGAKKRHSTIGFRVVLRNLDDSVARASYRLLLRGGGDCEIEVAQERCAIKAPDGTATSFEREASTDHDRGFSWEGDPGKPNLAPSTLALPMIGDSRFEPVFDFLSNMRVYAIDPSRLRSNHDPYGNRELYEDGSDTARVLRRIKKDSPDDWEDICELLSAAVPRVVEVQARKRHGELKLQFLQKLADGKARFDASDMSEGTLRVLGILVATYQRPAPSLMVIEEPEASIHPGALGVVLDVLRSATKSSQIVVTTHSPEVLDAEWIKDRHLRLVSWESGASRIDRVAPSVTQAMSEQMFGAGELLRSNALDGAERA